MRESQFTFVTVQTEEGEEFWVVEMNLAEETLKKVIGPLSLEDFEEHLKEQGYDAANTRAAVEHARKNPA